MVLCWWWTNSLASNSGLIPLVRYSQRYPREALIEGKTGFVTVRLTVDEKGRVITAIIEESRPPQFLMLLHTSSAQVEIQT